MLKITESVAQSIHAIDMQRTDGGLGSVFSDSVYQCRDVRTDAAYSDYWPLLVDAVPWCKITPRQGRLALDAAGLLDAAEAWIATQPRATQIDYESATEWLRDWPLIETARVALEWTHEEMDALFATAQTL